MNALHFTAALKMVVNRTCPLEQEKHAISSSCLQDTCPIFLFNLKAIEEKNAPEILPRLGESLLELVAATLPPQSSRYVPVRSYVMMDIFAKSISVFLVQVYQMVNKL